MIVTEEPAKNVIFNEDIALAGEYIIGSPCVVYSITLTADTNAAAIVNISDSATYDSAAKILKVAVVASTTTHLTFPKGLPLSAGLSAAANTGSIDITVTYD
jgi:hypothetical protein